ncbi:MAG: hypothetical protein JXA14_13340 [Anaerolineae bacterium]|nr:hypothetical protein [Anaerolineae bacterium]
MHSGNAFAFPGGNVSPLRLDVEQVVGLEGDAVLAARFLDEDEGLVVVIEAEGEGDVYAQVAAEVVVTDGFGEAAACLHPPARAGR